MIYQTNMTCLYLSRQRIEEEKADWIIYLTDAGQSTHFQIVFACAQKAGQCTGTALHEYLYKYVRSYLYFFMPTAILAEASYFSRVLKNPGML